MRRRPRRSQRSTQPTRLHPSPHEASRCRSRRSRWRDRGARRTTRARRPSRCHWHSDAPDRRRAHERRSRRGQPARPGAGCGARAPGHRSGPPQLGGGVATPGTPAGERLEQDQPRGCTCRTRCRRRALGLLGAEVVDRSQGRAGTAPSASAARRAIPESVTIARPSRESEMLPGFTSRWTMPRTWATPSARATSRPIRATSPAASRPPRRRRAADPRPRSAP